MTMRMHHPKTGAARRNPRSDLGRPPHQRDRVEQLLLSSPQRLWRARELAMAIYGSDERADIMATQRLISRLRVVKPHLQIQTVTEGCGRLRYSGYKVGVGDGDGDGDV